ncbi:uncharacterized protein LOC142985313 [Anticarsia gemmatalis]|uniref:uncharacterized protein LOC142985313 n=1 Tax=Anticarsia gemmatalis TaxID=129554 RepID=UPI003F758797
MCMYISACVVCGYTRGTRDIMTSRLHLLLAAACALALIQLASGQDKCDEKTMGMKSRQAYNFPPLDLEPGQAEWKIHIPSPPFTDECGAIIGQRALVCDYDKAPVIFFEDASTLMIQRKGELHQSVKLYFTTYFAKLG